MNFITRAFLALSTLGMIAYGLQIDLTNQTMTNNNASTSPDLSKFKSQLENMGDVLNMIACRSGSAACDTSKPVNLEISLMTKGCPSCPGAGCPNMNPMPMNPRLPQSDPITKQNLPQNSTINRNPNQVYYYQNVTRTNGTHTFIYTQRVNVPMNPRPIVPVGQPIGQPGQPIRQPIGQPVGQRMMQPIRPPAIGQQGGVWAGWPGGKPIAPPPPSQVVVAPPTQYVVVSLQELKLIMFDYVSLKKMFEELSASLNKTQQQNQTKPQDAGSVWLADEPGPGRVPNAQYRSGPPFPFMFRNGSIPNINATTIMPSSGVTPSGNTTLAGTNAATTRNATTTTRAPTTRTTTTSSPGMPLALVTASCKDMIKNFSEEVDKRKSEIENKLHRYAFFAQRRTLLQVDNSVVTVTYDIQKLNGNGTFNPTTGLFTSPRNGIYFFFFSTLKTKFELGTSDMTIQLVMNDTIFMAEGHINSFEKYSYHPVQVQATYEVPQGTTVGVKLVKGQIHGELMNSTSTDLHYTTLFTGFMVQPK